MAKDSTPAEEQISEKGYQSPFMKEFFAQSAKKRKAAKAQARKKEKELKQLEEKKFRKRVDSSDAIGCQFPAKTAFHERTALETVIWDGKINGVAIVVSNYLGHRKFGYVFPKKYKGRYALIPLKVGDYVFTAQYVNRRRNKVIRYCVYRMTEEKDGVVMLTLINVGMNTVWGHTIDKLQGKAAKEWNGKIPPRFTSAVDAVKARLNGSKIPFAERPQEETE